MATRVEPQIRQLLTTSVDDVWPGDDNVDTKGSDLAQWCREGGRSGLQITSDEKLASVRWRPLTPSEQDIVDEVAKTHPMNAFDMAFRLGFVSCRHIEGIHVRMASIGGMRGLSEESLRAFECVRADLPEAAALDVWNELNMGAEGYAQFIRSQSKDDDEDPLETYREALSYAMPGVTLPRIVGVHIAIATFRALRTRQ